MIELKDYYADWCGPCKMMEGIIEDLKQEYEGRVTVSKINIEDFKETINIAGITSLPTFTVEKDGVEVFRHLGISSKTALEEILNKVLNDEI